MPKKRRNFSFRKGDKDPRGGLTAQGRRRYNAATGAKLRPGVRGKADKPEEWRRKGSFIRRFYANPRGPLLNRKGEPTRIAIAARAWGEAAPRSVAAARSLAAKGTRLLERYRRWKARRK